MRLSTICRKVELIIVQQIRKSDISIYGQLTQVHVCADAWESQHISCCSRRYIQDSMWQRTRRFNQVVPQILVADFYHRSRIRRTG